MAKIVFTFFEVFLKDNDTANFVQKMEEVLKKFSGGAYHFRYIEESPSKTWPKAEWLEKP